MDNVIQRLMKVVESGPERVAQMSKDSKGDFQPVTYGELLEQIKKMAAGFHACGVKREEAVGFISDNRQEWAVCDFALLALGAADVPRGCDIMPGPMIQILGIPKCEKTILENEHQLEKLLKIKGDLPNLKTIFMIDPPKKDSKTVKEAKGFKIITYGEVMELGKAHLKKNPSFFEEEVVKGNEKDLATIIFTSGTTGEPKGVMLAHETFVLQAEWFVDNIRISRDEIWMSILPVWHSFERAVGYLIFLQGNTIGYSKPIGQVMLKDLQSLQPSMMTAVPRVWEALYSGIEKKMKAKGATVEKMFNFFVKVGTAQEYCKRKILGRNFQFRRPFPLFNQLVFIGPWLWLLPLRILGNVILFNKVKKAMFPNWFTGISGGGALAPKVDSFFAAAGIQLIEGYGLTEFGPFISVREAHKPVSGGVGVPLRGVQVKVVDPDAGDDKPLKPGQRGLLMAKSPQVMLGYYGKPKITAQVIRDGWLDTGDIVVLDRRDNIAIVGRAKDTIVLLGGENIEPVPLEQKICESKFIDNVVVLGQDCKYLTALVVPNFENIEEFAKENNITYDTTALLGEVPEIVELINSEISTLISSKNNFASFERIYSFKILHESFEVGCELSAKMELLRPIIYEKYKKEIKKLTK